MTYAPSPELQALVEQLGDQHWQRVMEAEEALASAGEAGMQAMLWGLAHPKVHIRRGCAGFMDHHGTDACMVPLREVALNDPAPSVRRAAVHSVTCQRCKPVPLTGDLVGLLVQVALNETSRRTREGAIWGLGYQPRDARAVAALEQLLRTETNPRLHRAAHHALKRQNPAYKAAFDAQKRAQGIAEARARRERERTTG